MKQNIICSLFLLTVCFGYSQSFSYFKFKGFNVVYLDKQYTVYFRTKKDYFDKIQYVYFDSTYIKKVLEFNEMVIKKSNNNLIDKKCPHIIDALEYTDIIYNENLKCKSKTAKEINVVIDRYKSLLNLAKQECDSCFNWQIKKFKQEQDSIIEISKKKKLELLLEQSKLDSIEKNKSNFFSPSLIAKVIGMPNATKKNLESEYQVELLAHRGGWDYYDFNLTNVGFKFGGNSNVCYKISFRLFGEDATDYENQIKTAGFKFISRKESTNLELEGDLSSQLMNGEIRTYKKGNVICDVVDGSYLGFTYYRIK